MKLGILITSDKHLDHVIGITTAATKTGSQVSIFCMDTGALLLRQDKFRDLCKMPGVDMAVCRHSAEILGVDLSPISKDIVCGSQFNNALMNHESDRVIVL